MPALFAEVAEHRRQSSIVGGQLNSTVGTLLHGIVGAVCLDRGVMQIEVRHIEYGGVHRPPVDPPHGQATQVAVVVDVAPYDRLTRRVRVGSLYLPAAEKRLERG